MLHYSCRHCSGSRIEGPYCPDSSHFRNGIQGADIVPSSSNSSFFHFLPLPASSQLIIRLHQLGSYPTPVLQNCILKIKRKSQVYRGHTFQKFVRSPTAAGSHRSRSRQQLFVFPITRLFSPSVQIKNLSIYTTVRVKAFMDTIFLAAPS